MRSMPVKVRATGGESAESSYDEKLFGRSSVACLVGHFGVFVARLPSDPDGRADGLEMIPNSSMPTTPAGKRAGSRQDTDRVLVPHARWHYAARAGHRQSTPDGPQR
jgi:hypothetical protein